MTASTDNRPRPVEEPESRPGPFGLSLPQLLAGAAAAMTSAVIAGRIGVAGTLVGAAVGSIVSPTAAAAYTHSLSTASSRLRQVRTTVVTSQAPAAPPGPSDVPETTPDLTPARTRRGLTLRTGALLGLATFVVALLAVTVLELGIGRPVSADDGSGSRTSVGELFSGTSSSTGTPDVTPSTPATDPTPADSPSADPSQEATPSVTDPASPSPSTDPSTEPSTDPSADPSPSQSPSESTSPTTDPSPSQPAEVPAPVVTP